jgi:hypothetical protein
MPLVFVDWVIQWCAFCLSRWSLIELLEYAGRFSILIAVVFYFAESGQRAEMRHYQAWQVINTAQGKGGSGGRVEAMSELNDDHVPLVAVDVSGAVLLGVRLNHADLSRGQFVAADMRNAQLANANLEYANLFNANLRNADLRGADLKKADLSRSDLTGANLSGADLQGAKFSDADLADADFSDVRNWRDIAAFDGADANHMRAVPAGFLAWATIQTTQPAPATAAASQPSAGN